LKFLSSARTARSVLSVTWTCARSSPVLACSGVMLSSSSSSCVGWVSLVVSFVGVGGLVGSSEICGRLKLFSSRRVSMVSSMACESLSSVLRFSILSSSFFLNSTRRFIRSASVDNSCSQLVLWAGLAYQPFEKGVRVCLGA